MSLGHAARCKLYSAGVARTSTLSEPQQSLNHSKLSVCLSVTLNQFRMSLKHQSNHPIWQTLLCVKASLSATADQWCNIGYVSRQANSQPRLLSLLGSEWRSSYRAHSMTSAIYVLYITQLTHPRPSTVTFLLLFTYLLTNSPPDWLYIVLSFSCYFSFILTVPLETTYLRKYPTDLTKFAGLANLWV